ncbi:MAG: YceI family protein [Bacteroidales bacterium]
MKKQHVVIIVSLLFISQIVLSQENFRLNKNNSEITVEGTSSVHDWEMVAKEMTANLQLKIEDKNIHEILNVNFSMPTEKLESDNSIMNKKSWSALKSNKHASIHFKLKAVSGFSITGTSFTGTANGTLTIAGKSVPSTIPFSGTVRNGNSITISGKEKINMRDFDVDPPTAMMGTLKTGEEVTIKFKMDFTAESQYTDLIRTE